MSDPDIDLTDLVLPLGSEIITTVLPGILLWGGPPRGLLAEIERDEDRTVCWAPFARVAPADVPVDPGDERLDVLDLAGGWLLVIADRPVERRFPDQASALDYGGRVVAVEDWHQGLRAA